MEGENIMSFSPLASIEAEMQKYMQSSNQPTNQPTNQPSTVRVQDAVWHWDLMIRHRSYAIQVSRPSP